jgi:hypothetical protein
VCHLAGDFDNGVVFATRSYGDCDIAPGEYIPIWFGDHGHGIWLANAPTPDGNSVTVGVYNIYGLPGVSVPHL